MEIRPATLTQLSASRNGRLIEVTEDVQAVANGLAAIDRRIRLRYSEPGEYFVVYYKPDDYEEGDGYLIFTAQDLDQRIVKHMEKVYWRCQQPGYSFADELDRVEAKSKRDQRAAKEDQFGEMAEKLAWAMREDTLRNDHKAFIGKGIPS